MYRIENFVVRAYLRNPYLFEGYRATRSRGPSDRGATSFRTSANRLSAKFVLKAVTKGRCSPQPPCGPPLVGAAEPMISSFLFLFLGPLIAHCAMSLAQLASLVGILHSTTVSIIFFDVWLF